MITRAEVEKLGALHAVEPVMLSLYLAVPPPPADPAALTVRVSELIAAAEENSGQAVPAQDRDRVLEQLPSCARDWPGPTMAIFACADSGLLQVIPLPCPLPERGVLGVRPHIRPLLLARQRGPACHVAPEDQAGLPACLAAVSTGQVQTLVVPADGLVPGYECGRCGTLSLEAGGRCPDWGTAALPVPDVIEEMVSRVLEDGGDVVVVCDGSSPVAVRLRRLPARVPPCRVAPADPFGTFGTFGTFFRPRPDLGPWAGAHGGDRLGTLRSNPGGLAGEERPAHAGKAGGRWPSGSRSARRRAGRTAPGGGSR